MEALADKRRAMSITVVKALVALVPACLLFSGSLLLFFRAKTVSSLMQLLGAASLVLVVLTHVTEALHLFPWMHWGLEHSVGHYVDFCSAVLGLSLFPIGYFPSCACKATSLTTTPSGRRAPGSAFSNALGNSLSGEGRSLFGSRPTIS